MNTWTQKILRHEINTFYYIIYSFGIITKSYIHQNSPQNTQRYTVVLHALNFGYIMMIIIKTANDCWEHTKFLVLSYVFYVSYNINSLW